MPWAPAIHWINPVLPTTHATSFDQIWWGVDSILVVDAWGHVANKWRRCFGTCVWHVFGVRLLLLSTLTIVGTGRLYRTFGHRFKGTVYAWKFDSTNPTAHAVWAALHDHVTTPYNKVMLFHSQLRFRQTATRKSKNICRCLKLLSGRRICHEHRIGRYRPT